MGVWPSRDMMVWPPHLSPPPPVDLSRQDVPAQLGSCEGVDDGSILPWLVALHPLPSVLFVSTMAMTFWLVGSIVMEAWRSIADVNVIH